MIVVKGELYGQARATTGPHQRMESSEGTGTQLLSSACLTVSCITTSILPPRCNRQASLRYRGEAKASRDNSGGLQGLKPAPPTADQCFSPLTSHVPLLSEVGTWPKKGAAFSESQLRVGGAGGVIGGAGRAETMKRLCSDL